MDKNITQFLYTVDLIAALAFFCKSLQNLVEGQDGEEGIRIQLMIHRVNTFLRFTELGLITIGKVPGNAKRFASLFMDRAFLSVVFLSPQVNREMYIFLALLYSSVDTIKYLYLLNPSYKILPNLKYTLPLLSNLLIPFLSVFLMSNYIKINAQTISYTAINAIRLLQLWYLIHGVINYKILWRERQEWRKREVVEGVKKKIV